GVYWARLGGRGSHVLEEDGGHRVTRSMNERPGATGLRGVGAQLSLAEDTGRDADHEFPFADAEGYSAPNPWSRCSCASHARRAGFSGPMLALALVAA